MQRQNVLPFLMMVMSLFYQDVNATMLDEDFYCRVYGCVFVGDGNAFDIYDAYDFSSGGAVAEGHALIRWAGNPVVGVGTVTMLQTGTLNAAVGPGVGQGELLGIDQNSDGSPEFSVIDSNNNGYLDLSDQLSAIALTSMTDIVLKDNAFKHSIYIAADIGIDIYAEASITQQSAGFATSLTADAVGFSISKVHSGVDGGLAFGTLADDPYFQSYSGIDSLNDIWGVPSLVASFTRKDGTHNMNAGNLIEQSVRLDFEYQLPEPDFSLGVGSLDYQVKYYIYKR